MLPASAPNSTLNPVAKSITITQSVEVILVQSRATLGISSNAINVRTIPRFLMNGRSPDSLIIPKPISGGHTSEYIKTYGPLVINNPPISNPNAMKLRGSATSWRLLSLALFSSNAPPKPPMTLLTAIPKCGRATCNKKL